MLPLISDIISVAAVAGVAAIAVSAEDLKVLAEIVKEAGGLETGPNATQVLTDAVAATKDILTHLLVGVGGAAGGAGAMARRSRKTS